SYSDLMQRGNHCHRRALSPGLKYAYVKRMLFSDRRDAGRQLGMRLLEHAGPNTMVLALPRGGIPVGFEVARALGVPLDVFVVRKLGVPAQEEFAMGAIASGGVLALNSEVLSELGIPPHELRAVIEAERRELER